MTVQHSALPNAELHEPKDINTANVDEVYKADGAGSGTWSVQPNSAYGSMQITNNSSSISVTAASDSTLHNDNDFVKITTNWTVGNVIKNMTFATDHLNIDRPGVYHIVSYITVSSDVSNIQVGINYSINDTTFVDRAPQTFLGTTGDLYIIAGNGFVDSLSLNDQISLYIAADKTANLTVNDAKVALILLEG